MKGYTPRLSWHLGQQWAVAHGSHPYREAPFCLPQILEGVVMDSGLLDIILDVVLVRHGAWFVLIWLFNTGMEGFLVEWVSM
jgi:hypothetical protein